MINENEKPVPLASMLRQRINRLAHQKAAHHENSLRAAMTAQLLHARTAGETAEELYARMALFESSLDR